MRDLRDLAYAMEVSGHVTVPHALAPGAVSALRAISRQALRAVRGALARNERVSFQPGSAFYEAASSLYCWGHEALTLLGHPTVLSLADELLGDYRLNDLTVFSARPGPPDAATTSWHRDSSDLGAAAGHLWFFFLLDDFTRFNGATWIVPGSHRGRSRFEPALGRPWAALDLQHFPTARQLLGRAGDLIVIDARALHTSGPNRTRKARRMVNLGLVHASDASRIRADHWCLAGPRIRGQASPALQHLLGADLPRSTAHRSARCVLPPGWRVDD